MNEIVNNSNEAQIRSLSDLENFVIELLKSSSQIKMTEKIVVWNSERDCIDYKVIFDGLPLLLNLSITFKGTIYGHMEFLESNEGFLINNIISLYNRLEYLKEVSKQWIV